LKLITLIVLYLAFSQISLNICGAVSRNHRYRSTRRSRTRNAGNKWYQLFVGLVFGLAGKATETSSMNECVPKKWQAVDSSPVAGAASDKSAFMGVINGVEKAINFICGYKDQIMKLLGMRMRRYLRRTKYRVFVQSKSSIRRALKFWKWWGSSLVNSVSNAVSSAAKSVANAASNAWNTVKTTAQNVGDTIKNAALSAADWTKKGWEAVKNLASSVVDNLKIVWSQAVNVTKTFLTGDIVATIKQMVACAQLLKGLANDLKGIFTGLVGRIAEITKIAAGDMTALANLIITLICNFSLFKEAFLYLIDGINDSNVINKFSLIGKFIGTAFRGAVTGRFRHRKH